ncbi:MAG: tetratricopeptide repeat protein [Bacteroidia bacterium]
MATTVKIFIASSAEVKEEREKCIELLYTKNIFEHLELKPQMWEYDIAHGSYPDLNGFQDAINPLLEESDLCIFIYYSKLGRYTIDEFNLAKEHKKKIIPFFKTGFSASEEEQSNLYTKLLAFKKSLNGEIQPVEYSSLIEFENNFGDQLQRHLRRAFAQSYENKPESDEIKSLKAELYDKDKKIEQLTNSKSLPDEETKNQLVLLEQQKQSLINQLNQNKEIQEQQAKDILDFKLSIGQQKLAKAKLKEQADVAFDEKDYEKTKALLKESAMEDIANAATTFYEIGKVSKIQLNYKEALHYFELAVKINPEDFDMNMEAGRMLRDLGYNDKAIINFEKALLIFQRTNFADEINLSYLYNELGLAYYYKGEYDRAIDCYKKALVIFKKIYGDEQPTIASYYNNLGSAYYGKGEYDKAINYYEKALIINKNHNGKEHPDIPIYFNNLGSVYDSRGEFDKAINYYEKALSILKEIYESEHPNIASSYNNLGSAYYSKNEYDKAIEYYENALVINKKYYGDEHPNNAASYNNLGLAYNNKREYDKAIKYYEIAHAINIKYYGKEHPNIATGYNNLGLAYNNKGDYDKAISLYEQALIIGKKYHSKEHPLIANYSHNLALAHKNKGL